MWPRASLLTSLGSSLVFYKVKMLNLWSKIPSSKTALGSALIRGHTVQSCPLGLHLILWCRLKNSPLRPHVTQSVPWCHLLLWLQAAPVQSTPSSHGSSPGLHKVALWVCGNRIVLPARHSSLWSGSIRNGDSAADSWLSSLRRVHEPGSVSLTSLALFHPFDQRQCLMCCLTPGFLPIP